MAQIKLTFKNKHKLSSHPVVQQVFEDALIDKARQIWDNRPFDGFVKGEKLLKKAKIILNGSIQNDRDNVRVFLSEFDETVEINLDDTEDMYTKIFNNINTYYEIISGIEPDDETTPIST